MPWKYVIPTTPCSCNAFCVAVMVLGLFHPSVALNLCPQAFEGMMVFTWSLALIAKSNFFLPSSTKSLVSKISKSHCICLFSRACCIFPSIVIRMVQSSSSSEKLKQVGHTFISCSSFHGDPWSNSSIADAIMVST